MNKNTLRGAADWLLPPKIFRLLTQYRLLAVRFALTHREILASNKRFHNRHRGERCFILCNGPSVKKQNIKPLKREVVFTVSNGYKHPEYANVAPRYHCLPQLTYSEKVTTQVAIDWFQELHNGIGGAELFLDCQEWRLVRNHNLFAHRQVNYVCMGKNYYPEAPEDLPDLSGIIPRAQSVPIMVLMIALYMGFKEIYLLGVDHDWFVKKEYKYFYEPGLLKGRDIGVRPDGSLETGLWEELPNVTRLWSQYRAAKKMAQRSGATIYNATEGGMLDEFGRVRLEEIL